MSSSEQGTGIIPRPPMRDLAMPSTPNAPRRALRSRAAAALAVTAVVAAGLSWQAPVATALTTVTTNYSYGDFENSPSAPAGWSVSAPSPNRAYVASPLAFSGTHSMYVEDTSTTQSVTARRSVTKVTPGAEYHVQGYVMPKTGTQYLGLRFYNAAGAVVLRAATPSTTSTMLWSRVEAHAVAPVGSTSVAVEIYTTSTAVSSGWWDAIEVVKAGVTNNSFESTSSTTPIPSWTAVTPSGTSAKIVTTQARLGSRSLSMVDSSKSATTTVTSAAIPVFPSAGHNLRAWIRPVTGSYTVSVRFLNASKASVGLQSFPARGASNSWALVAKQVTAPPTAHFATIELASTAASTGSASWDAIDFRPAPGAGAHTFANGPTLQPVDAFSNTNVATAVVVGGRAKLVSAVSGSPAEFQVIDIESGTVERRFPLGTMKISWALTTGPDNAAYVGGNDGHLWRWAFGAATITDVGRVTSKATTVFDLAAGEDGRVWGVSYPASELWSYNPPTETISNLGTVSTDHTYARALAVDSTYAWVGLGSEDPTILRVTLSQPSERVLLPLPNPVASGNITELDLRGRYLAVRVPSGTTPGGVMMDSERRLYDTVDRTWDVPANLAAQRPSELDSAGNFYYFRYKQLMYVDGNTGESGSRGAIVAGPGRDRLTLQGSLGGIDGEWILTYDTDGTLSAVNLATMKELSYHVEFLTTKMRIKSLTAGADSMFIGGYGGSSLAVLDANLTQKGQYPLIPYGPGVIGEVESTVSHGQYQYIGTYTDARVFRYDTTRPWDDGTNPALVATLGPTYQQDRPLAWATAGSRVFFGTVPRYGLLGGTLGIFENDSTSPRIVNEPVVDQGIVALAAAGDVVYGGTSRWGGLGATPTQSSAKVFAYNAATGRKLWEVAPVSGAEAFGAVSMGPNGTLWASLGATVVELNPATGATLRVVTLQTMSGAKATTPVLHNAGMVFADGLMYLSALARVYVFDPVTLRVDMPVTGGLTTPMIVVRNGRLNVAQDTILRQIIIR
ncbi:MAG: hypothetical protein ABIQ13_01015 [Pedococcus sp.]